MGRGIPRSRSPTDDDAYSNRKRRFHGWWRICGGGWPAVCDVGRAKIVDPRSASHSRNEASNSFLRYVLVVRRWNGLLRGSSRVLAGNGRSYLSRHSPDTERFLRFCFQRNRASRVWGARRWRKCTRDMRSRAEFCPTLSLPLSSLPEFSFFVGPIFISSLFSHFEEKSKHPEDRLKVNEVVIYLRRFLIFFFCSFVAKNSTFSFRLPASKFKHVSSTCIQPYFRKCHVVCQLTSLYLLMQTLSSVFAFNY